MQAITVLNQILHSHAPKSIVCCGQQACQIADQWRAEQPEVLVSRLSAEDPNKGFPLTTIHDLALVSDTLEHLSQAQASILLGQLRNAGARRIAVLVNQNKNWRFADFIGLGFKRSYYSEASRQESGARPDSGDSQDRDGDHRPQTVYTYDIASYNHKRKWNNADHWANLEMFDKARW